MTGDVPEGNLDAKRIPVEVKKHLFSQQAFYQGGPGTIPSDTGYLFLAAFFSRLVPSRARRLAVRFSAAATDAFFARADRS